MTLLFALVGKLRNRSAYQEFVTSVRHFAPSAPARLVARAVIAFELATMALLVPSVTAIAGFLGACLSLSCFTGVLVREHRRGSRRACNCFGSNHGAIGRWHIARNVGLVLAATTGLVAARMSTNLPFAPTAEGTWVSLALGAIVSAVVPLVEMRHYLVDVIADGLPEVHA